MELLKTGIALILNISVVAMVCFTLSRLSHKKDILKYYTYLSNLIALIGSTVFVAVVLLNLLSGKPIPLWLKGFRFTATYMLVTTLFVFSLVLLPSHKDGTTITADDFTGISPKLANLILHYLCPVISVFSFIFLERQPDLQNPEWTLYAAIPTILYWIIYLVLTVFKLWKDPYVFSEPPKSPKTALSTLTDYLMFLLIPALSMGLDYLLWWINTLNF